MLLQCLVLLLELQVPVHQSLVGVVDSLQVGVEASLVDFKSVVLRLKRLELVGEVMSTVVLVAVLLELQLLLVDKSLISLLILVDLDIEAVDHGLELGDVSLGGEDLRGSFLDLLGPHLEALI